MDSITLEQHYLSGQRMRHARFIHYARSLKPASAKAYWLNEAAEVRQAIAESLAVLHELAGAL